VLALPQPDGTVLFDREGLSVLLKRPKETIRKRCPVAEYHTDGRALYDVDVCAEILRKVAVRNQPTG
jgi:hypothetical protein